MVVVHFVDGSKREYADAENAALDGPVFKVFRWDSKRGVVHSAVLAADQVTLAEAFKGGALLGVIRGGGWTAG